MSSYYTINEPSEGLYKEKGSKFLSFAFPVKTETDIRRYQEELKKKYHDARHHCFAWIIGMDQQSWRANDDGEPAHSAGDPILGQIRSLDLTDTLVIVIRYFGGTKLGVGGLINAYKTATEMALTKAQRKEIFELCHLKMKFNYDLMSIVERLQNDFEIEVLNRDFREHCLITGCIKKDVIDDFNIRVSDIYELEVIIENE